MAIRLPFAHVSGCNEMLTCVMAVSLSYPLWLPNASRRTVIPRLPRTIARCPASCNPIEAQDNSPTSPGTSKASTKIARTMPSSRKINLAKVRASLDVVCPKCEKSISPAEVRRADFEHIECPGWAKDLCATLVSRSRSDRERSSGHTRQELGQHGLQDLGQRVVWT